MTYQFLEKLIKKYGAKTTFGEVIAKEKGISKGGQHGEKIYLA